MWSLRVLNGPQAGQIFNLKVGKNTLGRSSQADLKLMAQGVSKIHCDIIVNANEISIIDHNSSNGTFINGVRIQNSHLRLGDKFGVNDIMLDIIPTPQLKSNTELIRHQQHSRPFAQSNGSAAPQIYQQSNHFQAPIFQPHMSVVRDEPIAKDRERPKDFKSKFEDYLNQAVLPGVYKLAQLFDFKYVLAGFVGLFVFFVTLFSLFPMITVSKESIQLEARKRAMSLARALAETNRRAISDDSISSISTFSIEREDGVKEAIIVSRADGSILAPTTRSGRTSEYPFVNEALRSSREIIRNIDSTTLGASFPIERYDLERQEAIPVAFAIVIYDAQVLAMEDGIIVSLFMQNLVISMFFGAILFFFLFKLIEFPITSLNRQLDSAMREKSDSIENTFLFPPLQALAGNISSLLTRYSQGGTESNMIQNKDFEASMLIQHFRDPAFAMTSQRKILNLNSNFESLAQNSHESLMSQGVDAIVDPSLKQNIDLLMTDAILVPNQIHQREFDMGRGAIIIRCHAIMGSSSSEPAYFLYTIVPRKEDS